MNGGWIYTKIRKLAVRTEIFKTGFDRIPD